jgi:hypothetical protein
MVGVMGADGEIAEAQGNEELCAAGAGCVSSCGISAERDGGLYEVCWYGTNGTEFDTGMLRLIGYYEIDTRSMYAIHTFLGLNIVN